MYGDWYFRVIDRDMLRRQVTLYLAQDRNEKYAVLMADGTMREFPYNEQSSEDVGITIPIDAWKAIQDSLKPEKDTGEVARLEEALAVERSRVNHALGME